MLLAVILLQSCVAYQKTPVSLKEAENMGKAKVVFTSDSTKKWLTSEQILYPKNIISKEDAYFIEKGKHSVPLDTAAVQSVYLKDVKKSKRQTIAAIILPVVLIPVGFILFLALLPVE